MANFTDTFANLDYISTSDNAEVDGGVLRNIRQSNAVNFTGTGGISIGSITSSDGLCLNGSPFTVQAWVRMDSHSGDTFKRIIDKSTAGNSTGGWGFYINTDGAIYMGCNGSSFSTVANTFEADGRWHHVAMTATGATHRIFYDGELVSFTATTTLPPSTTASLYIGRWTTDESRSMSGDIARVYVHNVAFSEHHIALIEQTGMIPSTGLVDGWELNEVSGTNAVSDSGLYDGTLESGTSWTSSNVFFRKKSFVESTNLSNEVAGTISLVSGFEHNLASSPANVQPRVSFSSDQSTWGSTSGSQIPKGSYFFNGSGSTVSISTSGVTTFSFWLYPQDVTGVEVVDIDSNTKQIGISPSSDIVVNGFTAGYTIYVNGNPETSVVAFRWHHVVVSFDSSDSTDIVLGGVGAGATYVGLISDLRFYGDEVTASEVKDMYLYNNYPSDNLISHYLFDGNADDNVGSNNGVVSGALNFADARRTPPSGYLLNKDVTSLRFDGVGDCVQVADHNDFKVGTFDFSFSVWVYLSDMPNGETLASKRSNVTSDGWQIEMFSDGTISLDAGYASGLGTFNLQTVDSVKPFRWNHVCITWNGGTEANIYINGKEASYTGSNNNSTVVTTDSTATLDIGCYQSSDFIAADLANAAFWSDYRSASEVFDDYSRGFYESDANLVSFWPLVDDASDSVGSHSGTVVGTSTVYHASRPSSQVGLTDVDVSGLSYSGDFYYRLETTSSDLYVSAEHEDVAIDVVSSRNRLVLL